jgi:hypothetical protein
MQETLKTAYSHNVMGRTLTFWSFLHSQRKWLKIVSVHIIPPQAVHTKTWRNFAVPSTMTNEGSFQKLLAS